MDRHPDLRELVGDDVPEEELKRLRRVHELLLATGPPPEMPETMLDAPAAPAEADVIPLLPRRRLGRLLAAAAAALVLAFGAGYLAGNRDSGFDTSYSVQMRGTSLAPGARASVLVGHADEAGNTPMRVRVHGLRRASGKAYYELYLTRKGVRPLTCGTFDVGTGITTFELSIPYDLQGKHGWIVREEGAGPTHPVVMTT